MILDYQALSTGGKNQPSPPSPAVHEPLAFGQFSEFCRGARLDKVVRQRRTQDKKQWFLGTRDQPRHG